MSRNATLKIGLVFFFYTVAASFFIQFVLLVYIKPAWSMGHGLFSSLLDSASFHRMADEMAQNIRMHGWSVWSLKPGGQAPIGVIAAIYALTVSEPWTLIPLHASLHATAAVVLLQIVRLFLSNTRRAAICVLPFLLYPSAATWYAQIHKDGYFILGLFLIVYSFILLFRSGSSSGIKGVALSFCFLLSGTFLVWYVRPYLLKYLSIIEYAVIVGIFLPLFFRIKKFRQVIRIGLTCLFFLFVVYFLSKISPLDLSGSVPRVVKTQTASSEVQKSGHLTLPSGLQRNVEGVIRSRDGYIDVNMAVQAGSGIDNDTRFGDVFDVVRYFPRAAQIALLAPFPKDWLGVATYPSNTFMKRVAGLEMVGVYFALFFLPYAIWHWRRRVELWIVLLFSMSLLVLQGLVINNIGTLYRLRYGMLMLLVAMGIAGFIALREKRCAE